MPSGSGNGVGGLGVGSALSKGVHGFLNAYWQGHMFDIQQKQQQNAVIVSALTRQLEDETLPYSERARILDSIPQLVGAKVKVPLSISLGMDKFNDQDVQTGVQKGTPATPDQTVTDPNVPQDNSLGINPNITMKGTQATQDVPIYEKMGNLSPAFIKQQMALKTKAAEDETDLNKQARLLAVNYGLQARLLGKNGYTNKVFEGYDKASGNYIVTMANSQGETKNINLGKVDPSAIVKANIAASKPSGRLGQLQTAQQVKSEYEADPTSHSYSDYQAATKFLDDFEKTGTLKEAQIGALNASTTGTKPPTYEQTYDDKVKAAELRRQAQKDIDDADAEMKTNFALREKLAQPKTDAWGAVAVAKKKISDIETANDNDASQYAILPEYKSAVSEYNSAYSKAKDLEDQYQSANKNYLIANEKKTNAINRFPTTGELSSQDPLVKYKDKIQSFRDNNKQKTKGMTDMQIYILLKANGYAQ